MKGTNKVIAGAAAVLIAVLAAVAAYQMKFVGMANDFFAAVKAKDAAAVAALLPANSRQSQYYATLYNEMVPSGTDLRFEADNLFMQHGLLFTSEKTVSGTINPQTENKKVPVAVLYVKDDAGWKIKEVIQVAEKEKPLTPAQMQENEKMVALARESMADFVLSKKMKSMEHFHGTISKKWQKLHSVADLNREYAAIISDDTDWSFLNTVAPKLESYSVNADKVLTVIGIYFTKPKRLIFELNYIKEDDKWKLAGLKLFTMPAEGDAGAPAQPTDAKKTSSSKTTTNKK